MGNLLHEFFNDEMTKVDPEFFMRLNMSRLVEGDPIFNGSDFTYHDCYKRFPTIYHLRRWLMETDERADLRLVTLQSITSSSIVATSFGRAKRTLGPEFKDVFGVFACEKTKVSLGSAEDLDNLRDTCPNDCSGLLSALCGVYSAYALQGLLSHAPGKSISVNMVKKYDQYHANLGTLKSIVRCYCDKSAYKSFFRGLSYHELNPDDPSRDCSYEKSQGYTADDLHKIGYDDFKKEVEKLLENTGATHLALPSTLCMTCLPLSSPSYSSELRTGSWSLLTIAGSPRSLKASHVHVVTPGAVIPTASLQPAT